MPVLPFIDQCLRFDRDAVIELQFERFVGRFERHNPDRQRGQRKSEGDRGHQAECPAQPAPHTPSLIR